MLADFKKDLLAPIEAPAIEVCELLQNGIDMFVILTRLLQPLSKLIVGQNLDHKRRKTKVENKDLLFIDEHVDNLAT